MKKVLYISYDGMTDPLGQSQVLPYLVELAATGDYEFTLISFEKPARFSREKAIVESITGKAGIRWVPLMFTSKPPVLSKMYDRWRLHSRALSLHRQVKFDMVHCRSYVAAEVGLAFKKRFGTKFLFDMRGFWADEKVDSGHWKLTNPLFRRVYAHYKKKEKEFLLAADAIVSLTEAAKKSLRKQNDYAVLEIDVIPCCADLEHFNYANLSPETINSLRLQLGIQPGKKVITYLGSVGGWYMVSEMFTFFKRLLDKDPGFVMLFLTKDNASEVTVRAAGFGLPAENLVVRYATRKELPAYIGLSDCSIFFIKPTYSKVASSPTKHAELMGMGVPVICNDIGDTGMIVNATGSGIVVNEFSDQEFDRVIAELPRVMLIPKEKIRSAAFDYFDLAKGVSAYRGIYKRILEN